MKSAPARQCNSGFSGDRAYSQSTGSPHRCNPAAQQFRHQSMARESLLFALDRAIH